MYPWSEGLGGFLQSDCTVSWVGGLSPRRLKLLWRVFFLPLFKHQPPQPVETNVNLPTRPCDCIFYIASVLSIEPFQFLLSFWKVWVCLVCRCMPEKKKKVIFCPSKKEMYASLSVTCCLLRCFRYTFSCQTGSDFILYTDFYSILIHQSIHLLLTHAPCSFLSAVTSLDVFMISVS